MVILGILVVVEMATGAMGSRKLYNMALDQLREDKTAVVERLEQDKKEKAQVITELQNQVKDVQRKRVAAEAESQRLVGLVNEKNKEIITLRKEREAIVVSGDPDALVLELHKLGYGSAHKRN
jgi:hypothetical protein